MAEEQQDLNLIGVLESILLYEDIEFNEGLKRHISSLRHIFKYQMDLINMIKKIETKIKTEKMLDKLFREHGMER